MKLLKYFLFLMILSSSIYFLIELNELNMLEGDPIKIKIPFMTNEEAFPGGLNVWMVLRLLPCKVMLVYYLMLLLSD